MAKTKKSVKLPVHVPVDDAEAALLVSRVGDYLRKIAEVKTRADERIAEIQRAAAETILPFESEIEGLREQLCAYFDTRREHIAEEDGRRSLDLVTGIIGERKHPPMIKLRDKLEEVIAELKQRKLAKFLRTVEELNREAMLATEESRKQLAAVTGIRVVQDESFFVRVAEGVETTTPSHLLRKRIKGE